MYHYVYRIDRPSTGQFYIGIRSCSCWPTEDTRYMGSGTRVSRIPVEELVKTILVIVQTREEAARIEKKLVGPEQLEDPLCLNLRTGGEHDTLLSAETKERMSRGQRRRWDSVPGKIERQRVSSDHQGKVTSAETRCKQSEAALRVAADPEERARRSERAKGQHQDGNFGRRTWKS